MVDLTVSRFILSDYPVKGGDYRSREANVVSRLAEVSKRNHYRPNVWPQWVVTCWHVIEGIIR